MPWVSKARQQVVRSLNFEVIVSRVHVPALLFHISNTFLRILVVSRSGLSWIRCTLHH